METERSPIRPSDVPADLRAEAGGPVHALAVALRVRANRNTVHLTIFIRLDTSRWRVGCRFRGRRL
jgi:hypothetical protein